MWSSPPEKVISKPSGRQILTMKRKRRKKKLKLLNHRIEKESQREKPKLLNLRVKRKVHQERRGRERLILHHHRLAHLLAHHLAVHPMTRTMNLILILMTTTWDTLLKPKRDISLALTERLEDSLLWEDFLRRLDQMENFNVGIQCAERLIERGTWAPKMGINTI